MSEILLSIPGSIDCCQNNPLYEGRCLPGDGKWMELEFAGRLFGNGLDWLEIVICVMSIINIIHLFNFFFFLGGGGQRLARFRMSKGSGRRAASRLFKP